MILRHAADASAVSTHRRYWLVGAMRRCQRISRDAPIFAEYFRQLHCSAHAAAYCLVASTPRPGEAQQPHEFSSPRSHYRRFELPMSFMPLADAATSPKFQGMLRRTLTAMFAPLPLICSAARPPRRRRCTARYRGVFKWIAQAANGHAIWRAQE